MNFKKWGAWACMFFLTGWAAANVGTQNVAFARSEVSEKNPAGIEFITAAELKAKLAKNEPVTIIDVRGASGSLDGSNKIKGAVHVKLRRLRSRLSFAPLKDAPRDREVVTYCACPSDEASIRAAQLLLDAGFKRVRALKGGWVAWKKVNGQMDIAAKGL